MKIHLVRHEWPEKAGFVIDRPNGSPEYIFLHYMNPVELLCCGKIVMTEPDACIILPPRQKQWFRSEKKLSHDWIHITGDMESLMKKYGVEPDTIYYPLDSHEITKLVGEIESEFFQKNGFSDDMCEIKIAEILIRLARSKNRENEKPAVNSRLLMDFQELRKEMFSSPEKKWQIKEMAFKCGLSESRFYTVYKNIYGVTPNKDLIYARTEKAKNLLLTGRQVNEVAKTTGYESEYHFIRQFKKITGMTPGKYRR
jgi:AraC family transcriptional regulator of arabinose operon